MLRPLPMRFVGWLTAALVALWPAAAAQACCCNSSEPVKGSQCPSGCCAAAAETCCAIPVANEGICCATSAERDACGCSHGCAGGEVRQELNVPGDKCWDSAAAVVTDSWLLPGWHKSVEWAGGTVAANIPQRPKRILFGVWRN